MTVTLETEPLTQNEQHRQAIREEQVRRSMLASEAAELLAEHCIEDMGDGRGPIAIAIDHGLISKDTV